MFSSTRKKLCCVLSGLVLMSAFTSGAEAWYYNDSSTNDGSSEQRAYLINDIENFRLFRDRINSGLDETGKYYRLTSNIDLSSDTDWDPISNAVQRSISTSTFSVSNANAAFCAVSSLISFNTSCTVSF